jgi:hypothetical protein
LCQVLKTPQPRVFGNKIAANFFYLFFQFSHFHISNLGCENGKLKSTGKLKKLAAILFCRYAKPDGQ